MPPCRIAQLPKLIAKAASARFKCVVGYAVILLINRSEPDLVDALSASNTQLAALSQQINDEVTALGKKVSAAIQKAAGAIGALTGVLAAIL